MIGVALKGLLGRKLRAILTAFAIVLGVAMISGAFVLTDTLGKGFDGIYDESYASTDAVISSKIATSTDDGGKEAPAFSAERARQGRATARRPRRTGLGRGRDQPHRQGRQAVQQRRRSRSASQPDADQSVNPLQVVTGDWPRGDGADRDRQVDRRGPAASRSAQTVGAYGDGPVKQYEISGIVRFGSVDSLAGASISVRHGTWRLDWPRLAQSRFRPRIIGLMIRRRPTVAGHSRSGPQEHCGW